MRSLLWLTASALWLGATVYGLALVAGYDNRPGPLADAPRQWPARTALGLDGGRPTLVMFAHPRCDCTRASIAEFAETMARAQVRPHAYVVFIRPGAVGEHWEETSLWHSAAAIPGVHVIRDVEGVEAERFGAETSGQTMLYDTGGELLFSGGTTGSRGHAGDNLGRASILAFLNHDTPPAGSASVFGCPLLSLHVPQPIAELLPQ